MTDELNSNLDEFGLPKFIIEDYGEVRGEKQQKHELLIDFNEQPAEVDKIRITLRCGVSLIIEELWNSGVTQMSIQTKKGQAQFAVYDPNQSGYNAMKVNAPIDIL